MSDALLDRTILTILEQRLGRERVAKVVAAQLQHGATLLKELTRLEQAPDRTRIRAISHQIAGSSGSIGLTSLGEKASEVEIMAPEASEEAVVGAIRALCATMSSSFERLREAFPETVA